MINNKYLYYKELGIVPYRKITAIPAFDPGSDFLIILDQDYSNNLNYQELLNKILVSIKNINSNLNYKILIYTEFVNNYLYNNNNLDQYNQYKSKKIISFGAKINNYIDKNNILLAPSIISLAEDINLKRQLWDRLKIFCKN